MIRSEFPNGGKAIVEPVLVPAEWKKSKRAELSESQSGVSQSLRWMLKSPKTNILADGLIERTSSVLDEIE